MVKTIYIYYEGARKLREGFHKFFDQFYNRGVKIQFVAGEGHVVVDFMTSMKSNKNAINILLIDSEGPNGAVALAGVKRHGNWDVNVGSRVTDDQIHFMVQVMESWFLADRQALQDYYDRDFRENRLPANPNVEQIPKDDVLSGLREAARETPKGAYHKTRHAPDLLARIDAAKVCSVAPSCARLFDSLTRLTSQHSN